MSSAPILVLVIKCKPRVTIVPNRKTEAYLHKNMKSPQDFIKWRVQNKLLQDKQDIVNGSPK